ncbi:hypothetical protein EV182_005578 [Spiromyces aspiralis]|uniref:Uncharacterized protein n=1 Tax=Spiromyces aspiralis TaxID=68401 RepID=A0ACC1HPN8_9FUNG|nr:hypothetical protein EV182_005578 [Spiromyces aspiralis]
MPFVPVTLSSTVVSPELTVLRHALSKRQDFVGSLFRIVLWWWDQVGVDASGSKSTSSTTTTALETLGELAERALLIVQMLRIGSEVELQETWEDWIVNQVAIKRKDVAPGLVQALHSLVTAPSGQK